MEILLRFFKPILLIIILLSFNTNSGHAKPGTSQVKPEYSDYEDESQEVLSQLSVTQLLERWERAVDNREAIENTISMLIEKATIQGVSQELEDNIITARNKKIDIVRHEADLESEIDSRQVTNWKSTDSKEDIKRNEMLAKGMNDAFNTMRENVEVPVMAYWNASMPKNTAFSINDMFYNPRIFRNIHYFLNTADVRQNVIAGVMITKTPPVDMSGSIGFKQVKSSNGIFWDDAEAGAQFNPPKYVLYLSPDASYEDLMRDYESVSERMMLEQRDHMASAVEEVGVQQICGINNTQSELIKGSIQAFNDMAEAETYAQKRMASQTATLEEVLNKYKDSLFPDVRQEFEKLNLNQATILNYMNRRLNELMSINNPKEFELMRPKISALQSAIYQMQVNQLSGNSYFKEEDPRGINAEDAANHSKYFFKINGVVVPLY